MRYAWATGLLVAAVLLAHSAEITGLTDCDPWVRYAGFTTDEPRALTGGLCYVDADAGYITQALGAVVARDWLQLRLPWWTHDAGVGLPLAAMMQPAAFFLPFVLLLALPHGLLLLKITMQITGGFSAMFAARTIGLDRRVSILIGLLFALDGTFAWMSDAPMLPVVFMPLLIAGIERCRQRATINSSGGPLIVALAIGFSLLAGFPETALMDGLLGLSWCFAALLRLPGPARLRFALKVAAGGLTGLALAAPAVIPFLDGLTRERFVLHGAVVLDRFWLESLLPWTVPTVLGPLFGTAPLRWLPPCGEAGVALLFAALLGLGGAFGPRRWRSERLLLAGWALFWFADFLHVPGPYDVWRLTPGLNQVIATRYAMPSILFALVLLAGFGVADWRSAPATLRLRLGTAAAIITLVIVSFRLASRGLLTGPVLAARPLGAAISLAFATLTLAVLAYSFGRSARPAMFAAVGAVLMADLLAPFVMATLAGPTNLREDNAPVAWLHAHTGLGRVLGIGVLPGNYGPALGISTIEAAWEPVPTAFADYADTVDERLYRILLAADPHRLPLQTVVLRKRAAFAYLGVGAIVVQRDADLWAGADPPLPRVFESASTRLYALPEAAAYFEAPGCRLAPLGRDRVIATCDTPSSLLRRELKDPGWEALVNGRKLGIGRAEPLFQTVMLAAGRSDVRFRYHPPYARTIALLLTVGLATCAVFIWRSRGRIPTKHPRHTSRFPRTPGRHAEQASGTG